MYTKSYFLSIFWLISTVIFNVSASSDVLLKSQDARLTGAKDHRLIKRLPGSVIFDYEYSNFKDYPLLLGSIQYQESENEQETGYRATKIENLQGEVTRIIYDYPESTSTEYILNNVTHALLQSGFLQRFSCEKIACGSAVGWKAYLYPELGANDMAQSYLVASRNDFTVSFYLTEIAGQARGVFDIVKKGSKELSETARIYFDTGEYLVDLNQFDKIKSLVKVAIKENSELLVKGFADASGDPLTNQLLSKQRAAEVKKLLCEKLSIPADKIEAIGLGAIQNNANLNSTNLSLNRRVEIHLKAISKKI